MNKIHPPSQSYGATRKPTWLIFGEQCRERLGDLKCTKSGKREEQTINMWLSDARTKYAYPGTEYDWYCLLGWRGRR
jgi:hypothetical protein